MMMISNDFSILSEQLINIKHNFKGLGVTLDAQQNDSIIKMKNKMKFYFVNFEFKFLYKIKLKKSLTSFSRQKLLYNNRSVVKFKILLIPDKKKIKTIKNNVKIKIKNAVNKPYNYICRMSQKIN